MRIKQLTGRDQRLINQLLRNGKFEQENATTISVAQLHVQGVFTLKRDGAVVEVQPNIWVTEGFDYLLNSGVVAAPLYIAPYANNVAPQATWTAATFPATAGEITTGYSEATRQQWVSTGVPSGGALNNDTDAVFTAAAGGMTIWGSGLLDTSSKGGVTGSLIAATQFAASSTYGQGITASIGYDLILSQPS